MFSDNRETFYDVGEIYSGDREMFYDDREMFSGNREIFFDQKLISLSPWEFQFKVMSDCPFIHYDPNLISRSPWEFQFKESPGINRQMISLPVPLFSHVSHWTLYRSHVSKFSSCTS